MRGTLPGFAQSASSPAKCEFSNDWKKIFQWLEKMARIFQRLEKSFGGFPMIGKIFQAASRRAQERQEERNHKEQKEMAQRTQSWRDGKALRPSRPCSLWCQLGGGYHSFQFLNGIWRILPVQHTMTVWANWHHIPFDIQFVFFSDT